MSTKCTRHTLQRITMVDGLPHKETISFENGTCLWCQVEALKSDLEFVHPSPEVTGTVLGLVRGHIERLQGKNKEQQAEIEKLKNELLYVNLQLCPQCKALKAELVKERGMKNPLIMAKIMKEEVTRLQEESDIWREAVKRCRKDVEEEWVIGFKELLTKNQLLRKSLEKIHTYETPAGQHLVASVADMREIAAETLKTVGE